MQKSFFFSALALLLGLLGCNVKDPTEPLSEQPVFMTDFFLDTANYSLVAGQGGVYLFTRYALDSLERLVYSGSFADEGCPTGDCPGSLTLSFVNPEVGLLPDSFFRLGAYGYIGTGNGPVLYETTFQALQTAVYDTFSWQYDSAGIAFGPTFTTSFPDITTPHTVRLTATKNNGYSTSITRTISLSQQGAVYPKIQILTEAQDSISVSLFASASGNGPFTYFWSNGSTDSTQLNLQPGAYSLTVSDAFGETASASVSVPQGLSQAFSTADFTYQVTPYSIGGQAGIMALQWVDAQGHVWRSDRLPQPDDSQFQVLASEPYPLLNERGQHAWKMTVQFNCLLFNEDGIARPCSGSAVVAVAYP